MTLFLKVKASLAFLCVASFVTDCPLLMFLLSHTIFLFVYHFGYLKVCMRENK